MKEITMKVKGIECIGCENRIQNALQKLEEVEEVKADHQDSIVTLKTNEEMLPKIKEIIEDLGFTIVGEICKKSS